MHPAQPVLRVAYVVPGDAPDCLRRSVIRHHRTDRNPVDHVGVSGVHAQRNGCGVGLDISGDVRVNRDGRRRDGAGYCGIGGGRRRANDGAGRFRRRCDGNDRRRGRDFRFRHFLDAVAPQISLVGAGLNEIPCVSALADRLEQIRIDFVFSDHRDHGSARGGPQIHAALRRLYVSDDVVAVGGGRRCGCGNNRPAGGLDVRGHHVSRHPGILNFIECRLIDDRGNLQQLHNRAPVQLGNDLEILSRADAQVHAARGHDPRRSGFRLLVDVRGGIAGFGYGVAGFIGGGFRLRQLPEKILHDISGIRPLILRADDLHLVPFIPAAGNGLENFRDVTGLRNLEDLFRVRCRSVANVDAGIRGHSVFGRALRARKRDRQEGNQQNDGRNQTDQPMAIRGHERFTSTHKFSTQRYRIILLRKDYIVNDYLT